MKDGYYWCRNKNSAWDICKVKKDCVYFFGGFWIELGHKDLEAVEFGPQVPGPSLEEVEKING